VFDTRQLFGPRLDVPLNAVGYGPVGRQMPPWWRLDGIQRDAEVFVVERPR
jgi:hypothetical protein